MKPLNTASSLRKQLSPARPLRPARLMSPFEAYPLMLDYGEDIDSLKRPVFNVTAMVKI